MGKLWKYYKYYFCTLWKRPLIWLLTIPIIYAQYEQDWRIQVMIYVGFVLFFPLAVSLARCQRDYELEDIANDLIEKDKGGGVSTVSTDSAEYGNDEGEVK